MPSVHFLSLLSMLDTLQNHRIYVPIGPLWPRPVLLQGKKARMQKQAASDLDDISQLATKTMRDGKRKLPKILSWSRTN